MWGEGPVSSCKEGRCEGEKIGSPPSPAQKVVSAGRWEHLSTRSVGRGPWRGLSAPSWERSVWSQRRLLELDWLERQSLNPWGVHPSGGGGPPA